MDYDGDAYAALRLIGGGDVNLIGCTFKESTGAAVDILDGSRFHGIFIGNTFHDNLCSIRMPQNMIDNFKYIGN